MTSGSRYSQVLKGAIFLAVVWCIVGAGVPARAEVVDKVIVVVNDEVVTQKELDRVYEPLKKQYEQALQGDELAARLEQLHKSLLEQLVDAKLVISLAKKAKVEINEEEFKKRIDKIKGYYPSEEEFLKALTERGT
ncbi:MAG: SurA N-terminal domain-containing protein, partial [Verrucomicrobiota bacterium]